LRTRALCRRRRLRRGRVPITLTACAHGARRAQPGQRGKSLSQGSRRDPAFRAHSRPAGRAPAPPAHRGRPQGPGSMTAPGQDLALGAIGNCAFNALIDSTGRVVWCCLPRPDGDPVFHWLLAGENSSSPARGIFAVELENVAQTRQHYVENTAVLSTELLDKD